MKDFVYGLAAQVSIKPVFQTADDLKHDPLQQIVHGTPIAGELISRDLLSVSTVNGFGMPAGGFQLEFVPRPIVGSDSWDRLIRPYSLVSIALHRYGHTSGTQTPVPVMLGLVDPGGVTIHEDFSQTSPRRSITVRGQSLTRLLVEQRWWFHKALQNRNVVPPDLRIAFPPISSDLFALENKIRLPNGAGFLAIDPAYFNKTVNAHPADAVRLAFQFFVGQPNEPPGFIKVQFSDGRPLAYRLQLEAPRDAFVDSRARLGMSLLPTSMVNASCWDLLSYFCEPPFCELFSDTDGSTVDDARVVIHARKPPFLGHLDYSDPRLSPVVGFSGNHLPVPGASLFDEQWGLWDRLNETIYIDGTDIIGRPSLSQGAGPIFTAYFVTPQASRSQGNYTGDATWEDTLLPMFDEYADSPSNIQRYGIRPLALTTKYIPPLAQDNETPSGDFVRRALVYQGLLRTWFYRNPDFWSGQYHLKGRTDVRVGKRLVDTDRSMEFYVSQVSHHMDLGSQAPSYTTTVQVTRGWPLNPGAL